MKEQHLKKITDSLKENDWQALVIGPSVDMEYLYGVKIKPDERLIAVFILQDGRQFCVAPSIYKIEMQKLFGDIMPFYFWDDTQWFHNTMTDALRTYGITDARAALTVGIRSIDAADIAIGNGITFYNGEKIIAELRQIKDAEEIKKLRISSSIADKVMEDLENFICPGMTEKEAGEFVSARYTEYGAFWTPGAKTIVASGSNGAMTHYDEGTRTIEENDIIVVDSGARYQGYYSDITRTFFVGTPTQEQLKVFQIVESAQILGENHVRPGMKASDVDNAVRNYISQNGFGKYFTHRTGHGIGLEGHELPYISATNDTILLPGMVFSIEPGIYLPGKFGVRIENTVIVTENGCESLNKVKRRFGI